MAFFSDLKYVLFVKYILKQILKIKKCRSETSTDFYKNSEYFLGPYAKSVWRRLESEEFWAPAQGGVDTKILNVYED